MFFDLLPHFNNSFFLECRRASAEVFFFVLFLFCFCFAPYFDNSFFFCAAALNGWDFAPDFGNYYFFECRRASAGLLFFCFFVFVKTSFFWLLFFFKSCCRSLRLKHLIFSFFVLPSVPITEIKDLKAFKQLF